MPANWMHQLAEIMFVSLPLTMTLNALTGHEQAIEDQNIIEHVLTHIQHPAPKLILISALGFGCCVSSFLYRRQRDDPCQVLLIALVVGTVATVAYGVGASPDMMLLGLMPSATCAAMIVSRLAHDMFRTARVRDEASIEAQEKRQQP
jgi:hypothetical protein